MADPELPSASDSPAPADPQAAAPQAPTDTAIREKAPADSPPPTTAVTGETPAPAADEAQPRSRPSPEALAGRVRTLDRLLVGLVLVVAFFLGAFAIQNT